MSGSPRDSPEWNHGAKETVGANMPAVLLRGWLRSTATHRSCFRICKHAGSIGYSNYRPAAPKW